MIYYLLAFFFFIANQTLNAQLYSYSVNLNDKTSSKMIRAIQSNVTYIAVDDFFDIVNLPYKIDSETLREEISLDTGTLFITAYNPFLFMINLEGKNISYQMHQLTDYRYGKIFIPLKSFSDFLNKYTNIKVNFDEKAFLINIKYEKKSKSLIVQKQNETMGNLQSSKDILKTESNQISQPFKSSSQFDLFDFAIEEKSNGYIFRIKSQKAVQSISKSLSGNFLYLRIPNTSIDIDKFNTILDNGLIESVSAIQSGNNSDIKIALKEKIQSHEIVREKRTNDILLLIHVSPDIIKKLKEEKNKRLSSKTKNNLLDVIVIDAGHGGRDPGAIGYRGTKEKDVNLGIALKLGKLIEKNNLNVKVIYTRDDDRFIELYRRGQIANMNNGKLFISIHCNSTDERPGIRKGSEIYLLRPGRTEDAIRIAEKENSVIKLEEGYEERYKHLSDENFILTAMASTANVKHSEKFAGLLSEKFERSLPLKNNGVKQAGFYVLVGASMPSVLIETGYINNPEDELFLRSEAGQQKLAEAIYKAIIEYKNYYEKLASK